MFKNDCPGSKEIREPQPEEMKCPRYTGGTGTGSKFIYWII